MAKYLVITGVFCDGGRKGCYRNVYVFVTE